MGGYGNDSFGPEDAITREQMAAILYRYAAYMGYDVSGSASLAGFSDEDQISGYALDHVKWAVDAGLLQGKGDGSLDPTGSSLRCEVAAILHRFLDRFVT